MKLVKLISICAASLVAASLAGCGESPPGDADARAAMAKQIEAISGKEGVESQKEELAKIKVGKCVAADMGGFKCEVSGGMGGTQVARFYKADEGWTMVGLGG